MAVDWKRYDCPQEVFKPRKGRAKIPLLKTFCFAFNISPQKIKLSPLQVGVDGSDKLEHLKKFQTIIVMQAIELQFFINSVSET